MTSPRVGATATSNVKADLCRASFSVSSPLKKRDEGGSACRVIMNRLCLIYQYSNMALTLLGQTSLYLESFSFYLSVFWELRDKRKLKKTYNFDLKAISLVAMLEY